MSLTLPGGTDRLSREREEAHARYHEALAALDRIVNDTAGLVQGGAPSAADLLQRALTFQSLLIQFIQQITPYVDTKLRVIEQAAADAEMRATAAQRMAVARGLTGSRGSTGSTGSKGSGGSTGSTGSEGSMGSGSMGSERPDRGTIEPLEPQGRTQPVEPIEPLEPVEPLDSATYLGFEDLFRGSESDITERQRDYVQLFAGATEVLDVGCGRGEFLSLLGEAGIDARGIDLNAEMVQAARDKGLRVERADAVGYLRGLQDESLGGLFAAQVVEHLPPPQLQAFIREAGRVLRPGAPVVLETINPTCWVAFFESYIRDLTHAKPLHPETLKFLVIANGFGEVEIRFRTPIPEADRLQRAGAAASGSGELGALIDAFNLNMERLNDRLFTHLDYAVVARRV